MQKANKIVFLHAGLHKTATSSLQSTCRLNRAALMAQGVHYPLFHCVENGRKGIGNHSIPLRTVFNSSGKAYDMTTHWKLRDLTAAIDGYRNTLIESVSLHDCIFLSAEGVSSMAIFDLRSLKSFLNDMGATIVPLACVRSPYSHHCSAIQHALRRAVKGRGPRVPMTLFASQLPKVQALLEVFGEAITFLSFRQACADSLGPVGAVLRHYGLKPDQLNLVRANQGCSNANFRQVWHELADPASQDWTKTQRQERLTLLRTTDDGPKFKLNSTELEEIRDRLDAENQAFRQLLGDIFCDYNFPIVEA